MKLRAENGMEVFPDLCSKASIPSAMASLSTSTAKGITYVLYGYVPFSNLLASVHIVAATLKNNRRTQLTILREKNKGDGIGAELGDIDVAATPSTSVRIWMVRLKKRLLKFGAKIFPSVSHTPRGTRRPDLENLLSKRRLLSVCDRDGPMRG